MTQEVWSRMTENERAKVRSDSGLTPQLIGLEGWRVEVVTNYEDEEPRRFIVGRSTGWVPCHIELKRRDSISGPSADREYKRVTRLYKVR